MRVNQLQYDFAKMINRLETEFVKADQIFIRGCGYCVKEKQNVTCRKCGSVIVLPGHHMDNSLHYMKLAQDYALFDKDWKYRKDQEFYRPWGELWISWGGSWGGYFNDSNHFSLSYGGRK